MYYTYYITYSLLLIIITEILLKERYLITMRAYKL